MANRFLLGQFQHIPAKQGKTQVYMKSQRGNLSPVVPIEMAVARSVRIEGFPAMGYIRTSYPSRQSI